MEKTRKPKSWLTWFAIGLMSLVAYPLSSGPVAWFEVHGNPSPTTTEFLWAVYAPVRLVCDNGPPQFRQLMTWWTHCFVR